jgi:DNA replication ATP-dependent helicase Dna2
VVHDVNAPPLWDRLSRLLHREHHAILLGHRDLMTLPIDERVERGDSLAGLEHRDEAAGGRIRLRCADNLAKYRTGDSLRLGNGEHAEGARGLGVIYESFDDASGMVIVSRDPFRSDGTFDPRLPLQLDPEAQSLTSLALEGLARVQAGRSVSARAVRVVLEGVVERRSDPNRRAEAERQARAFVPALDASQREAFVEAMAADPVTLIQGPPGTGKTYVLARVVSALAARGQRVLVASYTHRAVNNALRMISAADNSLTVVKAGKASGADDLRAARVSVVPSIRKLPVGHDPRRVVGATLFSLRAVWEEDAFDVVVLDEAAQIPLTFAPCALLAAQRFVLVGDHRQLGPIVQGRHPDLLAARSVFEHLTEAYPPALLRTTYRMNAGVNEFPSRMFYGGRLAPEPRTANARFPHIPGGPYDELFDPERPAVLALVAHEGFRTRCPAEAQVVAGIVLDRIVRQKGDAGDIAVVSPFRAQLRLIRTLVRRGLDAAGLHAPLPVIDTVERIQGQERELVVVSLVASDPDHLANDAAAFFYSGNRLNVTITRARTKLIIVASPLVFTAFPKTLAGLADVERFRLLRRELPSVAVQAPLAPQTKTPPQSGAAS